MKRTILSAALLAALSPLPAQAAGCGYDDYRNAGNDLIAAAESGAVPADLDAKVDGMVQRGSCYLKAFAAAAPKCAPIVSAAVDGVAAMKAASVEELEEQWHDGGIHDGKIDVTDPELSPCLEMTHVIIHPLIVSALGRAHAVDKNPGRLAQMKTEIVEVLDQLEDVVAVTGK